jgi:hypothetical protein
MKRLMSRFLDAGMLPAAVLFVLAVLIQWSLALWLVLRGFG